MTKKETEFNAFKRRMISFQDRKNRREPPFSVAVKCRGGENNPHLALVVLKMYCKQFQFSSIEHDDLAKAVFELSNDFSESYFTGYNEKTWEVLDRVISSESVAGPLRTALGNNYAKEFRKLAEETDKVIHIDKEEEKLGVNLENYVKFMEEYLRNYKGTESSIARNWAQYAEQLKTLFDVENCVDRWGTCGGKWPPDFKIGECLDQTLVLESDGTYRQRMEHLLTQAKYNMRDNSVSKRYFCRIKDELKRNIGNRSKITTSLDELENMSDQDDVKDCFKEFRQLMNDRYNKALADQHGCEFLDLCDYKNAIERLVETVATQSIVIPYKLVKALAELSWDSFVKKLERHETKLKIAFDEWMSTYKQFPTFNIEQLKHALQQYLCQLASIITSVGSGDTVSESVGPWDEAGTCDDEIRTILSRHYRYPYYFVGGGSFEAGSSKSSSKGNEICILCVGENEPAQDGIGILRLRLDDEDIEGDKALDTLLAPVYNPLNGGIL